MNYDQVSEMLGLLRGILERLDSISNLLRPKEPQVKRRGPMAKKSKGNKAKGSPKQKI